MRWYVPLKIYLVNNSATLNNAFSTNQNHVYFLHNVSTNIDKNFFDEKHVKM